MSRQRNDRVAAAFELWASLTPEEQARFKDMVYAHTRCLAAGNGTTPAVRKRRPKPWTQAEAMELDNKRQGKDAPNA